MIKPRWWIPIAAVSLAAAGWRASAHEGRHAPSRAERLARSSLGRRTSHNGQTFALLASALLARHDFTDALDVARRAHALDPDAPAHLALMGEIELEIGDYAAADSHFHAIHFDGEQFTIGARIARWRELTGRSDAARRLLRAAARRASPPRMR